MGLVLIPLWEEWWRKSPPASTPSTLALSGEETEMKSWAVAMWHCASCMKMVAVGASSPHLPSQSRLPRDDWRHRPGPVEVSPSETWLANNKWLDLCNKHTKKENSIFVIPISQVPPPATSEFLYIDAIKGYCKTTRNNFFLFFIFLKAEAWTLPPGYLSNFLSSWNSVSLTHFFSASWLPTALYMSF